jgi:hypothetical protein
MVGAGGEELVIPGNQVIYREESRRCSPGHIGMIQAGHLLNQPLQYRVIIRNRPAHQFRSTQGGISTLMMVKPATSGINMHNARVTIGRSIIERPASRDKDQLGVACSTKADKDPDGCQTIQVWCQVTNDCLRAPHAIALAF